MAKVPKERMGCLGMDPEEDANDARGCCCRYWGIAAIMFPLAAVGAAIGFICLLVGGLDMSGASVYKSYNIPYYNEVYNTGAGLLSFGVIFFVAMLGLLIGFGTVLCLRCSKRSKILAEKDAAARKSAPDRYSTHVAYNAKHSDAV